MKLKTFRNIAVVSISLAAIYLICLLIYLNNHPDAKPIVSTITNKQTLPDADQLNLLVNKKRSESSLPALKINESLNASAQEKCNDIVKNDYWSHTSNSGEEFFVKIKNHVTYIKAGENLAAGYNKAESVLDGWMQSTEHRVNILDPVYTDVGYAVCETQSSQKSLNRINLSGKQNIIVQHLAKI